MRASAFVGKEEKRQWASEYGKFIRNGWMANMTLTAQAGLARGTAPSSHLPSSPP